MLHSLPHRAVKRLLLNQTSVSQCGLGHLQSNEKSIDQLLTCSVGYRRRLKVQCGNVS